MNNEQQPDFSIKPQVLPIKLDREKSTIKGVKILGFDSKNNRTYPPHVVQAAVPKYEGVKVNIDHPPASNPGQPRSVADRFGVLKNVAFNPQQGLIGDLHYNPNHPLADQVAWAAEHQPNSLGFSHNAMITYGRDQDGKRVVSGISSVKSVDLVADPATTNGLFESVNSVMESDETQDNLKQRLLECVHPSLSPEAEAVKQRLASAEKRNVHVACWRPKGGK